jgi:hypothetical protein
MANVITPGFTTLITGGCSFTEDAVQGNSWPSHVANNFALNLKNTAVSGIGNRNIARRVIHMVEKELQEPGIKNRNILVGICWSTSARTEYFKRDIPSEQLGFRHWTKFVYEAVGDWVSINHNWLQKGAKDSEIYYKWFHDALGGVINTLESIMWVQNYLNTKGIDYFMTSMSPSTFGNAGQNWLGTDGFFDIDFTKGDGNISWLFNAIKSQEHRWLPVDSYWDWMFEQNNQDLFKEDEYNPAIWNKLIEYIDHTGKTKQNYPGWHPSPKGHRIFTQDIIIPYLEEKYKW